MKALAKPFTIGTHTCEIYGLLTEWRGLEVKIIAHRCTRNRHRRWHAESAIGCNLTLKIKASISNESFWLTFHNGHFKLKLNLYLWNIWRSHWVKGYFNGRGVPTRIVGLLVHMYQQDPDPQTFFQQEHWENFSSILASVEGVELPEGDVKKSVMLSSVNFYSN